jgi:hypothetical protein
MYKAISLLCGVHVILGWVWKKMERPLLVGFSEVVCVFGFEVGYYSVVLSTSLSSFLEYGLIRPLLYQ